MASLQDIRHRIKSVKSTKQITSAMNMVATSRLRHAKEAATANRPYAQKVSEVVLAAQFSDDKATRGRYGNQMHLYYPSVYQNLSGCIRDISGDREFCYVSATEYSMQVFDRVNDSRFWKSFITTYNCNSTKGAPSYTADDAAYLPDGKNVGDKRFVGKEIGVKYIVNDPGDTRFTDENGKKSDLGVLKDGKLEPQHTFIRYYKGENFSWNISKDNTTGS